MFEKLKLFLVAYVLLANTILVADNIFTKDELKWIKENPTVKIAMLNDYKPFSYIQDSQHQGLSVDLIKKISKISGLTFDIKTSQWTAALNSFKNADVDMISDISYTQERSKFTLYTPAYYEIPTMVFGLKNNTTYQNNNSLIGKKVAITTDVFYKDKLKKLGIRIVEFNSSLYKVKALESGKVEYFLDPYLTAKQYIDQLGLTNIKMIGEFDSIKKEDLRFGINKNKQTLYNIINKSFKQIPINELINLSNKWMINAQSDTQHIAPINFTKEEEEYLNTNPIIKYSEINWKPLSIIENNKMKGIMGDYLDLVTQRTGIKFQYVHSDSWPNVLKMFEEKKIDLVPGVGSSPQELKLGLISDAYAKFPMVIVTNDKYKYLENLSSLQGKTIAVPKYFTSYNFIVKNYPNMKLITTSSIPEALLKVENGEADAYVGHIATSLFYISEQYLKDLKITGTTKFDFEHHYLIQKNNPILLSIINKAFASITTQEQQNISSKWVNTTTVIEKSINYTLILSLALIILIAIIFVVYRQRLLKKYNQELKHQNEQIETILNTTVEAIILSENGLCTGVNNSALELFQIKDKNEILGTYILDLLAPDSRELVKENIIKASVEQYEVNIIKRDGTISPALVKGNNVKIQDKTIRISSVVDLTELKNKEKLLIEQSKLASMGEMIGNIAHQWRQPLSVISTSATGMQLNNEYGLLTDELLNSTCETIDQNAQYLSKTIDDFRDFIKGDRQKIKFNLLNNIKNFLNLVQGTIKRHNINLILNCNDDIHINGYKNELIQCYMNIFNNAKDALENIEGEKYIFIDVTLDNQNVIISIKDNAGGIKEDIIPRIFEPYFSTKHQSKGTGLGLFMSYNLIVDGMSGSLKASNTSYIYENQEYIGAKFEIKLPIE